MSNLVAGGGSLFCLLMSAGCSNLVHWDSVRMREYALDYYDNQVMDNLVRASQGRLILHVNIGLLSAETTVGTGLQGSGGRTATTTRSPVGDITNVVAKPFGYSLSPSISDKLQLQSKPVVDDPDVYGFYLQFLCLENPTQRLSKVKTIDYYPGRLPASIGVVGGKGKPEEAYVEGTYLYKDGKGYYIREDYRRSYHELCMALTGRLIVDDPVKPRETNPQKSKTAGGKAPSRFPSVNAPMHSLDKVVEDITRQQIELNKE